MQKDIGLRGASRRDFIRGVFTASAALGLGPGRALDMLEKMGGSALASSMTNPSYAVHMIFGNGAISRATQLVAVPAAVKMFNPASTALDANPVGSATISTRFQNVTLPSGFPYYARLINGQPFFGSSPWSVYVSGQSQAHSVFSVFNGNTTTVATGGNVSMFSAMTQIQTSLHALVPAVAVNAGGNTAASIFNPQAAGAPGPSAVPSQAAIIGLFSSAASTLMTRLGNPNNQNLYSQYYTALMGLTRWAGRPTYTTSVTDAQTALGLVVKNLGSQLAVQPGQGVMWAGPLYSTNNKVSSMTDLLITSANAFKLGLTPSNMFTCFDDDPHGAFAIDSNPEFDATGLAIINFKAAMDSFPDPLRAGKTLGDRLLMTMSGDTIKDSHQRSGWPDGTPGGANLLYVYSPNYLKGGFIGDILPNARVNWDPTTGQNNMAIPTATCTSAAAGMAIFAMAAGVSDTARTYYSQIASVSDSLITRSLIA